jgi:cytochrome oxidase Cu insertion factor (SCO1/SenC/PrrC family)
MSASIRCVALATAVMLMYSTSSSAQQIGQPAADEQTGLKVGENAPRFTLRDQEGRGRSLDEFLKKGKVALVFYRSADW